MVWLNSAMRNRRQWLKGLGVALLVLFVGGLGLRMIHRAGLPKHQGRTPAEWIDHVTRVTGSSYSGYSVHEAAEKEIEVAFRSMGAPATVELIRERLNYERATGYRTNLFKMAGELPPSLRLSYLQDPRDRYYVVDRLLDRLRPDWSTVEPILKEALEEDGHRRHADALRVLGNVGDGASNAVPYLTKALTNKSPRLTFASLVSLSLLGTNAAPFIPLWIREPDVKAWQPLDLRVLGHLGQTVRPAVPKLRKLMESSGGRLGPEYFAAALLAVVPDDERAFEVLNEYLAAEIKKGSNPVQSLFVFRNAKSPNPAIAKLAANHLEHPQWNEPLLQLLMRHDPDRAIAIHHQRLATGSRTFATLDILLEHDPAEPVALADIDRMVASPKFSEGDDAYVSLLYPLRHCFPDTPGVIEILEKAEAAQPPERAMERIDLIRRHIELNGQLRDLRQREFQAP